MLARSLCSVFADAFAANVSPFTVKAIALAARAVAETKKETAEAGKANASAAKATSACSALLGLYQEGHKTNLTKRI